MVRQVFPLRCESSKFTLGLLNTALLMPSLPSALRVNAFLIKSFLSAPLLLLAVVVTGAWAQASTIAGTVKDQTGAVIEGARIEISGGALPEPTILFSDRVGRFTSADLKPGSYSLKVSRAGFESDERTVELGDSNAELELTLGIAHTETEVLVTGQALDYLNSDPIYRQLRSIGFGETFRVQNVTVPLDAGTFVLRSGTITLLSPVNGAVTGAVFVGDGHFSLKAALPINLQELKRRIGEEEVNEDITEAVFRFSHKARLNLTNHLQDHAEMQGAAAAVFGRWKERLRRRHDVTAGFTESLLTGADMDNVDADVLATIYNEAHPPFFNAYMRGKKHKDLRYFVRLGVGALPQVDSSEEVALINYDPGGMEDGIWYLDHLKSEYQRGTARSDEDRRLFMTRAYKIETVIAKNQHLYGAATITFQPIVAGERVMKFGLLPNLRVLKVTDEQGKNLFFIQESRKEDGSFYVVLPAAPAMGKESKVTVEYAGDKVLTVAGDGSFYVQARSSWYPNLNGFGEHAMYDLTFKVPRKYKVISVGKLQSETTEQDFSVSHWTTAIPIAVAGFNYGSYEKIDIADDITHFHIAGYYLSELPDNLRNYAALRTLAPKSMTRYALEQTRAQVQLCSYYFGKIPYEDLSVTEQPNFNFGQSWPNLIYLPISAYTDSTQRWMLFGGINARFSGFVQEVTPHEVAHQWWGHAVTWSSYHDQWLSEGFAEFTAGLFLEKAMGKDWRKDYMEFWQRLHDRILEKNNYGVAPTDAGPLWLGERLDAPRSMGAYQNITYPKGAYVLEMLRSMMRSMDETKDPDGEFIAMMHEFVETHKDKAATTESFKAVAEKHMTKLMDLQGNHKLDWFFREWVYGTEVPRYRFEYTTSPAENGKVKLHLSLTQSEVDDNFVMLVPVFADFGKGMARLGQIAVVGNKTRESDVILPMQPKKVAFNAYKEVLQR
jgi:hypothetical protein